MLRKRAFLLSFLVFVMECRAENQDPCKSLMAFPELHRRLPLNIDTSSPLDDMYIQEGWYGQQDVVIPYANPGYQRCGTIYPIYLKEKPEDDVNVIQDLELCLGLANGGCSSNTYSIETVYCGNNLRAYNVKRIRQQYSAYCAGPDGEYPNVNIRTPFYVDVLLDHGYTFGCNFQPPVANLFYTALWYVDGKLVFKKPAVSVNNLGLLDLTEAQLIAAGVTSIGFTIKCNVRVSFRSDSTLSPPYSSQDKFIGIEIESRYLKIDLNQLITKTQVVMKPSVRFGCTTENHCNLDVNVMNIDKECGLEPSFSNCGVTLDGNDPNKKSELSVSVKEMVTLGKDIEVRTLHLKTIESYAAHELWQKADLGKVFISVIMPQGTLIDKNKGKCSATVDPHMKSFTGKAFEHHYLGTFILYRNKHLKQEVQIKTDRCYTARSVTCVCGVTVRAGRRVYELNVCGAYKLYTSHYVMCDDHEDILNVKIHGSDYKITLASQTVVDVVVTGRFLNVFVYASPMDIQVEDGSGSDGLCGTLTKEGADIDTGWIWTVNEINLFDSNQREGLESSDFGVYPCNCYAESDNNKPVGDVECKIADSSNCKRVFEYRNSNKKCPSVKTKRAAEKFEIHRRVVRHTVKRNADDDDDNLEPEWQNGWTEDKAREYCQGVMDISKAVQICKDLPAVDVVQPVENCVLDIKYLGSADFARVAVELVKADCFHEIETNLTMGEIDSSGNVSVFDEVKRVACPNECSDNGICADDGTCVCDQHFQGYDCGLDIRDPPEINYLEHDGFCDIQTDDCSSFSLYGGYFAEWEKALCRLRLDKWYEDGMVESDRDEFTQVYAETLIEAICTLPKTTKRTKRGVTEIVPEKASVDIYRVAIANDGESYSSENKLIIYNSRCQQCTMEGSEVQCSILENYCVSGSDCYGKHEPLKYNDCFICSVNGTNSKWEQLDEERCGYKVPIQYPKSQPFWIIGAVMGVVVLISLVVGVIILRSKRSNKMVAVDPSPPKTKK